MLIICLVIYSTNMFSQKIENIEIIRPLEIPKDYNSIKAI